MTEPTDGAATGLGASSDRIIRPAGHYHEVGGTVQHHARNARRHGQRIDLIIALPAIFRGIQLDPLTPGNVSYLLWMLMGYLVVSAVLRGDAGAPGRHLRAGPDVQRGLRDLRSRRAGTAV